MLTVYCCNALMSFVRPDGVLLRTGRLEGRGKSNGGMVGRWWPLGVRSWKWDFSCQIWMSGIDVVVSFSEGGIG